MKYALLLSFGLLFVFACNEPSPQIEEGPSFSLSEQAAELYQIVGEKHDTAMLLTKNIENVQHSLRSKLETIKSSTPEKDSLLDLLTALKKADDSMMDWMHEFKNTDLNEAEYQAMSEQEILTYLREEEAKIEQVHVDMLSSIANGKHFLRRN